MAESRTTHLAIAQIVAPHGIKGEVKARILTDFPERFRRLKVVFVGDDFARRDVVSAHVRKGQVYLHLKGCDTAESAERLRG